LRRLVNSTFFNLVSSFVGFVTNYFIIRWFGLSYLGELSIINSFVGMGSLIYTIIPPNYSIIKWQDEKKFPALLLSYYILATIPFLTYIFLGYYFNLSSLSLGVFFSFSLPLVYQNYFDIYLQAENKLDFYFKWILCVSILKLIVISILSYYPQYNNFNGFMLALSLPQLLGILFLSILFVPKLLRFVNISEVCQFIKINFVKFTPYYLNTILKRIRENLIILLFSPYVSKSVLGLYSLFIKIDQFILGLTRSIESFFMNKDNLNKYKATIMKSLVKISVIMSIIYLIVGSIYMYVMVNNTYLGLIMLLCISSIPYVFYIIKRSELLTNYNNKIINLSELSFIIVILFLFASSNYFNFFSITFIILSYICAKIALYIPLLSLTNKN
jgi:hypothetical protein